MIARIVAILALVTCALGLGGCVGTPAGNVVTQVQTFTVADLQNAAATATAVGDTVGAQCWNGLIPIVQAIKPVPSPSGTTAVGVATGIEAARAAIIVGQNLVTPATKTAIEEACGPLVADQVIQLNQLGLTIVLPQAAAIL